MYLKKGSNMLYKNIFIFSIFSISIFCCVYIAYSGQTYWKGDKRQKKEQQSGWDNDVKREAPVRFMS